VVTSIALDVSLETQFMSPIIGILTVSLLIAVCLCCRRELAGDQVQLFPALLFADHDHCGSPMRKKSKFGYHFYHSSDLSLVSTA
jgi:hypothetical protein